MNPSQTPLGAAFFDRDAQVVACDLLGKVMRHVVDGMALMAVIIETEAYYQQDKASHASLGVTEKRRALFMPPGTIYMYYARGGDSFNVSCAGAGNAVLIKAGLPYPLLGEGLEGGGPDCGALLAEMLRRTPLPSGKPRAAERICSGQTLLCKALGLRVPEWDGLAVDTPPFSLLETGYRPSEVLRTTRLGIPEGRDGHLPYRFVDRRFARLATRNPLATRLREPGRELPRGVSCLQIPAPPRPVDWAALTGD